MDCEGWEGQHTLLLNVDANASITVPIFFCCVLVNFIAMVHSLN